MYVYTGVHALSACDDISINENTLKYRNIWIMHT